MLTLKPSDMPPGLLQIPHPPRQLFYEGIDMDEWLNRPKVAIVGSRKITPYGKAVTENLASDLARMGAVIISGLAYGVDVTAHRAALAAGGLTVAVLPSGLDSIYPSAHHNIARHITGQGGLITEYDFRTTAFPSNFITRNRLISGLADILLITEAALKSGSLHTARFALEQGKTVMAVPGNITSQMSEGCNNLIKSGAIPVTSAEDILFALHIKPDTLKAPDHYASDNERLVHQTIKDGLSAQDEIAATCRISGPQLASILTMLEIAGYIRPAGGGNWVAA